MSLHTASPSFSDIFAEDVRHDELDDVIADARHVTIAGHRYTRRRQDTMRVRRARQQVGALPPVISERDWVAAWIELIDASLYTPPGTPRAGRILREAYADASIRLPAIRDLGCSLLPATLPAMVPARARRPVERELAAAVPA